MPATDIPVAPGGEVGVSDAKAIRVRRAVIFSVGVIAMSASLAWFMARPPDLLTMGMPTIATLLMLLVVSRDGYTRAGWVDLGLHRSGVKYWPVAILGPLFIGLFAVLATVLIGQATLTWPKEFRDGDGLTLIAVGLAFALVTSLLEEIGWRGYLLPHVLPLGQSRALVITGLVWATWHVPFILWMGYHSDGNLLLVLPLFYGTILAAGFFFGYMRLYSDSVWPAAIGHGIHNFSWGVLSMLTVSSNPVVVEEYLGGDNGVFILVGTILLLIWARRHYGWGQQLVAQERV